MLVVATGGELTLVQRDSREALGGFFARAWETHLLRRRPRGGGADDDLCLGDGRRQAQRRLGCSYAGDPEAGLPGQEAPGAPAEGRDGPPGPPE